MGKRVNNVSQLVNEISSTKTFKKKFVKEIKNKSIANFLFAQRCDHKLTQKQMAEKIKCSQSRISKIESSYDNELAIKDLQDYAKALNLRVELGFRSPSVKIVDLIKYHAFKIKHYLEQLTKLAQEDEVLKKGIKDFHMEALYNITKIAIDSFSKLNISKKKVYPEKVEQIHISTPIDMREFDPPKKLMKV